MHLITKTFLAFLLVSLAACASGKPPRSSAGAGPPDHAIRPSSSVDDAEQRLRTGLDALNAGRYDAALLAARSLEDQYPGTPWYRRSLFLSEQALIQMDRQTEADAAMLRVLAEYPEMADYAVSILADYHFSKARFSQAAALYQHLTDHYPKSSLAVRAAFRRAQALFESYAYGHAVDALDAFLQDNARSETAPDAALTLGHALVAEARLDEAVLAYRNVWAMYPGTAQDQEAARALTELSASGVQVLPWSPDEWYERGKNLYRSSQYDKAAEAFGKLTEMTPASPHRAEALFRIGVCQYYLGRRGDAAALLEKMAREYPRDERTPEAWYWIGKSYSKLGEREKGVAAFKKILDVFPENEWADDALFLTGNIYREANDMNKALVYYGRLAAKYPGSRFADSALWWNAWAHYREGAYANAELTLQQLVKSYPRSSLVGQARYWKGRISEKTGDPVKAASYYSKVLKEHPYTYYGYLAADRMGKIGGSEVVLAADAGQEITPACADATCMDEPADAAEPDEGPPVWTEETRRLLTSEPSFKKTLELMHLQMKKEAAEELWYLKGRLPRKRGALIGLSKAFFELGDYYRSLILVLRNYEGYLAGAYRDAPSDLWLLAYPRGYWDSILLYSRKYGQDPYFVSAIIREESQFHPEALSPAGARGVMQVMPATGQWIAQSIRLRGFDRAKLFESDTAINLGTWYVGHLMKRFRGDPLFVAAAYNAGPEAVAGWLSKNHASAERDEFVEAIPYSETRGYVKKVLRNYAEYRRIYGRAGDALPVARVIEGGTIGAVISRDVAVP